MDLVRIGQKTGDGHFWRSLDELAQTPAFRQAQAEFPQGEVPVVTTGVNRRDVLKLMSASAALAGLTACTKLPPEKIVPYVKAPEELVPGVPLFYATAMPFGGVGRGLLVESHMGRPTKVEGNPDHPASLGAADVFGQASVLTLYDPDRSQVPIHLGRVGSWAAFLADMGNALNSERPGRGAGLRILTETISSPTLAEQIRSLLAQFPAARWHQYEPCARDNARTGARAAFGDYVNTVYRFDQAEVILSLESDFLFTEPGSLHYARDFSDRRRVVDAASTMNRLYVVESTLSMTGAMADHRLPLRSNDVEPFARLVARGLGLQWGAPETTTSQAVAYPADWIPALVRDLEAHRGSSLVIAGEGQPPAVHALAHVINRTLDNVGKTVAYTDPIEAEPTDEMKSLGELVDDMDAGRVQTLVIIGGNPAYDAPADLPFAEAILKVGFRAHLGLYQDETAVLCHWHIPEAHYLETWGDVRAYDGTVSIIQPLIAPLYAGKSSCEMLAALQGQPDRTSHDIVREYWQRQAAAGRLTAAASANFEGYWETSLNNGWLDGTALPPKSVALASGSKPDGAAKSGAGGLELVLRPDPCVWDGRFANNAWLEELPRPFTKLSWDNALLVGPATAAQLGIEQTDVVKLRLKGRELKAPVLIMPGQAAGSMALHLGYGRTRAGGVGSGVGVNAYAIRTSDSPWFTTGVALEKTGERHHLVTTQNQHLISQNGRESEEESGLAFERRLVRVATLEDYRKNPAFAQDPPDETEERSLYPQYDYSQGYSWGMSIDLNSCTGCNACVVACYAENNIAVVGKEEVDNGRDMQWIRVDTYYRGALGNPEIYNEILLCQHCENAPCEYVCPVGATVHSPEGLNVMVYNRCVGTRYCSNNCPYKVRRFNFKLYSDWSTPSLYPLRNPDVTVRSRGVMEKCTYCLQRINEAKIRAEREDRVLHDGEIQTACQQTCPTQAIVFGNINDPGSRVAKLKAQTRQYGLLRDLNTRPRTTYLARLRNQNPEIKA